jgi:hypothetical protein
LVAAQTDRLGKEKDAKDLLGFFHCGSIRFEVDLELDHVRVCDSRSAAAEEL